MAREILFQLGAMITDRLPYKFHIKKLTEEDPEYIILDRALESDEQAEIMLKMGLRKPKTLAQLEKITGKKRFAELMGDLITWSQGNPTLVTEDDKRMPYSATGPNEFAGVTTDADI